MSIRVTLTYNQPSIIEGASRIFDITGAIKDVTLIDFDSPSRRRSLLFRRVREKRMASINRTPKESTSPKSHSKPIMFVEPFTL